MGQAQLLWAGVNQNKRFSPGVRRAGKLWAVPRQAVPSLGCVQAGCALSGLCPLLPGLLSLLMGTPRAPCSEHEVRAEPSELPSYLNYLMDLGLQAGSWLQSTLQSFP